MKARPTAYASTPFCPAPLTPSEPRGHPHCGPVDVGQARGDRERDRIPRVRLRARHYRGLIAGAWSQIGIPIGTIRQ